MTSCRMLTLIMQLEVVFLRFLHSQIIIFPSYTILLKKVTLHSSYIRCGHKSSPTERLNICVCVWVLSHFSHAQLHAFLWTVVWQAPLSIGFSRQEYWSELPCPPPGDLPDPGIEPESLESPVLAGGFFTTSTTWKVLAYLYTWF